MKFSQFCETAENTEQEQQLLELLKDGELKKAEEVLEKMTNVPVIGKLCAAVIALINTESIAEFRQSSHYQHLMDMEFSFDFDKRSFYITPSDVQKKQIKKTLTVIGGGIALLLIYRKLFRRKKTSPKR